MFFLEATRRTPKTRRRVTEDNTSSPVSDQPSPRNGVGAVSDGPNMDSRTDHIIETTVTASMQVQDPEHLESDFDCGKPHDTEKDAPMVDR
jgi:hypothetical protein